MPKSRIASLFVACLAVGMLYSGLARAVVVDLNPAPYRGATNSVLASWEFLFDSTPGVPPDLPLPALPDNFFANPQGPVELSLDAAGVNDLNNAPDIVTLTGTLTAFQFTLAAIGMSPTEPALLSVLATTDPTISLATFAMPNYLFSGRIATLYRIQTSVFLSGALPAGLLGLSLTDAGNNSIGIPLGLPTSSLLDIDNDGTADGTYIMQDLLAVPSPDFALVSILVPTAPVTINVIIESLAVPEPAGLPLLLVGLLAVLRLRRRR